MHGGRLGCPSDLPLAAILCAARWVDGRAAPTMRFDKGAKCWNGPQRSLEVVFECGPLDELLGVAEPDTCTYTATMATPAACGP